MKANTTVWSSVGLLAGLLAFGTMRFASVPASMNDSSWAVAALTILMAVWWLTEAVPLAATALVPVVLVPMLGIAPLEAVVPSYAHPLIFLFLGGFLIARALERWDLHRRIAAWVLRVSPLSPTGLIGSMMLTTAFLSMWISNTAAAMLMIPIGQSIARSIVNSSGAPANAKHDFKAALTLSVAFAATIGGMASLIGTPPNALLAGYLEASHGLKIGFGRWMIMGIPLAAALLVLTWTLLTRVAFRLDRSLVLPADASVWAAQQRGVPLPTGAKLAAIVIGLTGVGLLARPLLHSLAPGLPISDASIAMLGALLLFIIPAFNGCAGRLLHWEDAKSIRWDVLILFGGGLALATAIESSGLALFLAGEFSAHAQLPSFALVLLAMVIIVLLGELASNTAMAAIFLPIAGAAAVSIGVRPLELIVPVGLAASLGFMLPVATPPNAIAFGTGDVSSQQMIRVGALLDSLAIPVVYVFAAIIGPWIVMSI